MKFQTKSIALLATVWFMATAANAQVTIGSGDIPHIDALLELKQEGTETKKGLLLPRVELQAANLAAPLSAHVAGMHVYNTGTNGTALHSVRPGEYYNDGTKWVRVNSPSWFYAPSMPIDISTPGPHTLDLWQKYHEYFDGDANGDLKHNPGAAYPFPKRTFGKRDLNYFVTGYDATVFTSLSIDDDGVMRYTVALANVTDATFINIIFVVK